MESFIVNGRSVGPKDPPLLIAEVSANHGGDLARAKRIISQAAAAGADAVKFQLYGPDSLTLDIDRPEFRIGGASIWKGERLYDLYARAATPLEWFPELFAYASAEGVIPFASVFDDEGIQVLSDLSAPMLKIASFEAVDLELVAQCAGTGKPVIVSTGLCTLEEISDVVDTFVAAGGQHLCLLHCNSAYPADPREANLLSIPDMAARFRVPVGYSDHTLDSVQAIAAVALGASVVEKHVIDSREPPTADSSFSCLPRQFKELVIGCRAAFVARGSAHYGPSPGERSSLGFRRSLFVTKPMLAGMTFTRDNVRSLRPGAGLPPKRLREVLGRTAKRNLDPGTPLSWDVIA